MKKDEQILKTRDDKAPVHFSRNVVAAGEAESFTLADGSQCSWLQRKEEPFQVEKLRERIEPWLTALFQSEHFALLVGSGLPHALHYIATEKALPGMATVKFVQFDGEINVHAKKSAKATGRMSGNIEDQIRVANELLRGIEVLSEGASEDAKAWSQKASLLADDLNRILKDFSASILKGENGLVTAKTAEREKAFNYLVGFLMSFASRTGTRDRLQIYTTNYDRYIEAGADVAGLHLLDRFVGSLYPIFRSSRLDVDMHYNPPGIRGEPRYLEGVAKFTKLHGSLDWTDDDRSIRRMSLPFGTECIEPYLNVPGRSSAQPRQLMIYPNSAKDRETAAYPYVELFRDFAAGVCRPNSTLICFGYSFGDEHINRGHADDTLRTSGGDFLRRSPGPHHANVRKNGEARADVTSHWRSSWRSSGSCGQLSSETRNRPNDDANVGVVEVSLERVSQRSFGIQRRT
jgi:SIR2-like domain